MTWFHDSMYDVLGILLSAGYEEFLVLIRLDNYPEAVKWNRRADYNSDSDLPWRLEDSIPTSS